MSNELVTLAALCLSLLCLIYLRNTDPKRRRVYRLNALTGSRLSALGWLLCLIPGVVLFYLEFYGPFIMWFAALSVIGWLVSLPKPKQNS